MKFGARFANERKKKGLSVIQTAVACGISRSYVVLIENSKRQPGVKILPKIARAFNLSKEQIIKWYLEDVKERLEEKLGKY